MRILLLLLFSITIGSLKAQVPYGNGILQRSSPVLYNQLTDSSNLNNKWSLVKYGNISTSFAFFNGGSASRLSAPIGLQLNRRLNNNLYAFAGVSVAPTYINFNRSFANSGFNKTYPGNNFYNTGMFDIYSRAEMGLMYVNDQKTFSISGSISIEKSSYPIYPIYPSNRVQQQPAMQYRQ